ncbi:unnamed protein product [Lactuca virosa]|uniref:Uncharacterized protein n=1 Tax=Lactuca virosa TaxID=75947 RepID=A0AAU9NA48_9ASTR|nr:unnamed protein product [Lactuca virosa]CAH1435772.1 unnamed protein product [Lactuca virosa]
MAITVKKTLYMILFVVTFFCMTSVLILAAPTSQLPMLYSKRSVSSLVTSSSTTNAYPQCVLDHVKTAQNALGFVVPTTDQLLCVVLIKTLSMAIVKEYHHLSVVVIYLGYLR